LALTLRDNAVAAAAAASPADVVVLLAFAAAAVGGGVDDACCGLAAVEAYVAVGVNAMAVALGVTTLFCPHAAGAGAAATGAAAAATGAAPFVCGTGAGAGPCACGCCPHAVATGAGRQAEPAKAAGPDGVTEPLTEPFAAPFCVTEAVPAGAAAILLPTIPPPSGGKATCAGSPKGVSLSSPG
jgi:hypothetical protein